MNGLQLLKDHPKAAIVIKQWFLEKLLENLNSASIPDDYKEFLRKEGIDDDKVAVFIDSSPRGLFDVFDNHKVFIQITVDTEQNPTVFRYSFDGGKVESVDYQSRKEAESVAIQTAFKILNDKL